MSLSKDCKSCMKFMHTNPDAKQDLINWAACDGACKPMQGAGGYYDTLSECQSEIKNKTAMDNCAGNVDCDTFFPRGTSTADKAKCNSCNVCVVHAGSKESYASGLACCYRKGQYLELHSTWGHQPRYQL